MPHDTLKHYMPIELGSFGSIGNIAGSLGRAGGAIEGMGKIAPALAGLGEAMKAPLGNIVKEGPVRGGFLEGFRPMNISDINPIDKGGTIAPLGEIVFQPSVPSVIEQAESVAAAAWEKREIPTPTEAVLQAEATKSLARNPLIKPGIF